MMKLANERRISVEELLKPFEVKIGGEKIKIGLTLCEDMWWENYSVNPTEILVKNGVLNIRF